MPAQNSSATAVSSACGWRASSRLSNIAPAMNAALDGIGLAYVPTDLVFATCRAWAAHGRCFPDWCPAFQGYHLYYPSRRNPSPAFSAFVDAFRHEQRNP